MKRMDRKLLFPGICLCLIALAPTAPAQDRGMIRISGAGLLSDVVEGYAAVYKKEAPNCSVTVTGATTGIGFQRLVNGESDIAMMTRAATAEETKSAAAKGISLDSKYIGQIGLAVITNARNAVNELTMDQLAAIFKGEVTNWSQVGGPGEPIKVTIRAVPETGAGVL